MSDSARNSSFSDEPRVVSIIIATYNDVTGLKMTINSLLTDDYQSKEIIVIDGGSSDSTRDFIQSISNKLSFFVSEPDEGIYDAWNKGLRAASGRYIAFLGAGDQYVKGGLARLVGLALSNLNIDFVSSKVEVIHEDISLRVLGGAWTWETFRRYMSVAHVGSLHSRRLFNRYGEFDTSFRIAGDYEFLLRAGQELQAAFLDQVVVKMAAGGASQRGYRVFEETERAKLKHQTVPAIFARYDTAVAYAKRFLRNSLLA